MTDPLPRLRADLQIFPADVAGDRVLVVQDPLGLAEGPLMVGGAAMAVLPFLDGRHRLLDVQAELTRRGGRLVFAEEIRNMVRQFEACRLLDTPGYREARAALVAEFTRRATLPGAFAGEAYPSTPGEFVRWAEGLLSAGPAPTSPTGAIRAVVSPHIDFRAGARAYAAAYGPLRGKEFDRVVILGVGHSLAGGLLALSDKAMETPLGTISCDRGLACRLRAAGGSALAPDDFAFRGEHSVEFQAVLLRHVLGGDGFRVVPVLAGHFAPLLESHRSAEEIPGVARFLEVLAEALRDESTRTLVVAGVDLSHCGPKFGDRIPARAITAESQAHDRRLLDAACRRDGAGLWQAERETGGRFNVCGFSALACLLDVLPPGTTGRLSTYETWHEEQTRSSVSFAAALFTG